MAGVMLYLSLLGGAVQANPLTSEGKPADRTDVWQVPHKPKGTKIRLSIQPKEKRSAPKKTERTKTEHTSVPKISSGPSSRYVAIKSNLVYWAGAVMNLGAEVRLHEHISLDLPFNWSLWDIEREHGVRLVLFQPEARWWMKSVGEGHFVGVHAHVGAFNVKWQEDRYQTAGRPLLGAGVTYGYSLPFSEHWGVEFVIGAGYANMKYNQYYNIDNGAQIGKKNYNYWGITRIGASLVYRF